MLILKEVFSIETKEELLVLDEIIKREIASIEFSRKYPMADVIRHMIVAIPVTGLLSLAFQEFRDGNINNANPLIASYLLWIGLLIIISGVMKLIREFGTKSYLNDISMKIQLSLLEQSIQNKFQDAKHNGSSNTIHKRRKRKVNKQKFVS
jgi:hypothetical protein